MVTVSIIRKGWKKITITFLEGTAIQESDPIILQLGSSLLSRTNKASSLDFIFENEKKNHLLGTSKYSKEALGIFDRYCWTDYDGRRVMKPEYRCTPSPVWEWCGEWKTYHARGLTDEQGWMYAAGWEKRWNPEKSFGKLVRRRILFREMHLKDCEEENCPQVKVETVFPRKKLEKTDSLTGSNILDAFYVEQFYSTDQDDFSYLKELDFKLEYMALRLHLLKVIIVISTAKFEF